MVILGYGEYKNYRIEQVPEAVLSSLAIRYKLSHQAHFTSEYQDLQITVAVHEEMQRRRLGGTILPHEPSVRELARKLVTKGYQVLSKEHHPDRKGGTDIAQKRLNNIREQFLRICEDLDEDYPDNALIIPEPPPEISDEDIPF